MTFRSAELVVKNETLTQSKPFSANHSTFHCFWELFIICAGVNGDIRSTMKCTAACDEQTKRKEFVDNFFCCHVLQFGNLHQFSSLKQVRRNKSSSKIIFKISASIYRVHNRMEEEIIEIDTSEA
jgi:hypothetical protein